MISIACFPTVYVEYLVLNKSIGFGNCIVEVLGQSGFIREMLISANLLDFNMQNTPLLLEAFHLISVGCSPTVYVDYLMLNKSIGYENFIVEVLGHCRFIRVNINFGEIT